MLSSGCGAGTISSCGSEGPAAVSVVMSVMARRMPRAAKKKKMPNPSHSQRSSILDSIMAKCYCVHPIFFLYSLPSRRGHLGESVFMYGAGMLMHVPRAVVQLHP